MKSLVTGGTGFIGSHVVRKLLAQKIGVRCLIRATSNRANLAGLEVEYVIGDLKDPASLKLALTMTATCCFTWPRTIASGRAIPQGNGPHQCRRHAPAFQAAADAGIKKIIYTSSVAAIGRPVVNGASRASGREDLDPTPDQLDGGVQTVQICVRSPGARFARQDGLPIVIVNPAAPIGSQDIKPTPTGKMIVDFLNGKMPAYVDTGMNFIDVEDVAAGHWLAAEKGKVGERYIPGQRKYDAQRISANLVARLSGRPAPRVQDSLCRGLGWRARPAREFPISRERNRPSRSTACAWRTSRCITTPPKPCASSAFRKRPVEECHPQSRRMVSETNGYVR